MAFRARCKNENCQQLLFDVPDFESISEKRPVILACQGCGSEYKITHKGTDILFRMKGEPATGNQEAEKYG